MAKFQAYSNYASIMASQGIRPDSYQKWLGTSDDSKPIDTSANSDEAIAAFTAKMNEEAKRERQLAKK